MAGTCSCSGSMASLGGQQLHVQHRVSLHCLRRRSLKVQAAKTADGPSLAIVGVTGAVGQEFLRVSRSHGARNAAVCTHLKPYCIRKRDICTDQKSPSRSGPEYSLRQCRSASLALVSTLYEPPRCYGPHLAAARSCPWQAGPRSDQHPCHPASLQVLKERDFPYSSLKLLASARWGTPSCCASHPRCPVHVSMECLRHAHLGSLPVLSEHGSLLICLQP